MVDDIRKRNAKELRKAWKQFIKEQEIKKRKDGGKRPCYSISPAECSQELG